MRDRPEFSAELAPVAEANPGRPAFAARVRPDPRALPKGAVRLSREQTVEPRPDKIRLPVVTEPAETVARPARPQAIRVVAGQGRIVQDDDGRSWLEQSKVGTSVLSSDDASAGTAAGMLSTGAKTSLPWLIVDARQRPRGNQWRTARPFLKLARGFQWEPASRRHVAQFSIGLDAEDGEPSPLTSAVRARIVTSCDEVSPADVILGAVGRAGDQTIAVACSAKIKNERPQQSLGIRLPNASLDYQFEIPHRAGAFQLVSSVQSALGLGIDSLPVTVTRCEEDRTPLPVAAALDVPLHARGSEIDPSRVTIPTGESQAIISVRPRGVGSLQLSAGASAQESEALPIELSWPVLLLLLTSLGGALGGYLSAIRPRGSKPGRHGLQYGARRAIEGALVGMIAILATLALPSLALVPEALRSNEIAWFVMAIPAGFSGIELVETLSGLLFRKKDQPAVSPSSH